MMIPDGTSRLLARDRERDIRKHLSDREMERQARDARPHRPFATKGDHDGRTQDRRVERHRSGGGQEGRPAGHDGN
jgi:hypothetical protein